ncbi:MAG: TonB-dependent receptor [Prevotellaceae bacterium]|jgi:hypothetical protein|nr:TonB-dependent receptor [Prevotellaceae bacterium]
MKIYTKPLLALALTAAAAAGAWAQQPAGAPKQLTQVVRGRVVDKNTLLPIAGVDVSVNVGGKLLQASTNEKGEFSIGKVPVGRHSLAASMTGLTPFVLSNILVNSGKEAYVEIAMEELIRQLDDVVVTPNVDKDQPLNKMATVSARMLSSEEANRYAGSWGDPARMAANFAGVIASNDARNDIIIRGNSPSGLLWRLDGFEIPNPNHFGSMGGTGGPISMINNNQLTNSDFYTGAFPAEFGNATSGVFDLKMRSGNNAKHELVGSVGFNGFELGVEGPVSKKSGASYMLNGRYSFLQLLGMMGVNMSGAEGAIPEYQDASGKVNIPLKQGNLSAIFLLGASHIHAKPDMNEGIWLPGDRGESTKMSNRQYFVGANYTVRLGYNARLENRLSYQNFTSKIDLNLHTYPDNVQSTYFDASVAEGSLTYAPSLHYRLNSRNLLLLGGGVSLLLANLKEVYYGDSIPRVTRDAKNNATLVKGYAQWQHRFSDAVSVTSGVYAQHYSFSGDFSVEPRLGFRWAVTPQSAISFGAGLHSQLQPHPVYFYNDNGTLPNQKLRFTKSLQSVVGYDYKLSANMRMKVEAYYQYLFDVPVYPDIPEQSILNLGDGYYNSWSGVFVNKGTGKNYGVELTLEKFFESGYYFLLTGTLYRSTYKGYDNVERNTRFAGSYTFNALGGYEWKIGGHTLLSLNTKLTLLGNKRILPTSRARSGEEPTYDYLHAYEKRLPDYFRWDLNVSVKNSYRKYALEWFIEVENVTNHKNIWEQVYNVSWQAYDNRYQTGLMPMGGCKVFF